jgi:hypothetical protein
LSDRYWIEARIHASEASGKMERVRVQVRLWTDWTNEFLLEAGARC